MIEILESLKDFPVMSVKAGEKLLAQGETNDTIYFLVDGSVEVIRDGYKVANVSDKGAVFGEMSILLDIECSALIRFLEDSKFIAIKNPRKFLEGHPKLMWYMAQILGLRLFNLNQYLVDIKHQYEGHDHLDMVDDVLETLLNQQKTKVMVRGNSKRDTPDY